MEKGYAIHGPPRVKRFQHKKSDCPYLAEWKKEKENGDGSTKRKAGEVVASIGNNDEEELESGDENVNPVQKKGRFSKNEKTLSSGR